MLKRDRAFWVSLNRALDRVLDLPASERDAWLAALDQESPGIATEVRRLLSVRDSEGFSRFLAREPPRPPRRKQD